MISINELLLSSVKIKNSKRQNLLQAERSAMTELKDMRDIIIKPADKGLAVVVMNTNNYTAKAEWQLLDTRFYKKCDRDLTEK